jgi:hypothetical protein
MRPKTLADVALLASRGEVFDLYLSNFLDEFYAAPDQSALVHTPELLAPKFGEQGRVQDAYLAATAEYLAAMNHFPIPQWVVGDNRQLHQPWFASQLASLRAVLLLESPATFRARNLFVSENALTRV